MPSDPDYGLKEALWKSPTRTIGSSSGRFATGLVCGKIGLTSPLVSYVCSPSVCNIGSFEDGRSGTSFCKGEKIGLSQVQIEKSSEGRLIVGMSPLYEDYTNVGGTKKASVLSSPDWHGYSVPASWAVMEGNDGHTNCFSSVACNFSTEPTIEEYLNIDTKSNSNDGNVNYYFAKSLYNLSDGACVQQCLINSGETVISSCDSGNSCCDDSVSEAIIATLPWFHYTTNVNLTEDPNDWGYGTCNDSTYEPSTYLDIRNTSAGHNGHHSPNWLGVKTDTKDAVPTIFEAFESWCTANPTICCLDQVRKSF